MNEFLQAFGRLYAKRLPDLVMVTEAVGFQKGDCARGSPSPQDLEKERIPPIPRRKFLNAVSQRCAWRESRFPAEITNIAVAGTSFTLRPSPQPNASPAPTKLDYIDADASE